MQYSVGLLFYKERVPKVFIQLSVKYITIVVWHCDSCFMGKAIQNCSFSPLLLLTQNIRAHFPTKMFLKEEKALA